MSTTKKDGTKANSTRKQSTNVSKTSTKTREDSTDRKNSKRLEDPIKTKTKQPSLINAKQKITSSTRHEKSDTNIKVAKKVSTSTNRTSSDSKIETRKKVPGTPTSTRVSKTQFFPSKNMYSNALKVNDPSIKSLDVKKSVTLTSNRNKTKDIKQSPSSESKPLVSSKSRSIINEIKSSKTSVKSKTRIPENKTEVSSDSSTMSERPRTATLRKGSIVNTNIVGPDIPKVLAQKISRELVKAKIPSPKSDNSDEYKYEDDFETYESDFEEYSSSTTPNVDNISGEETSSVSSDNSDYPILQEHYSLQKSLNLASTDDERKLDSGNFDMPDYKYKQMLDNIKEYVEKENENLSRSEIQRNNPASLSDEGFEDQKSLQFINFLDANKKYKHRKSMESKLKRGAQILSMIRLDIFSFTLFDLPPVPYEVFIKRYGSSNTMQTASQTGEDDINEEVQTEEIYLDNKWTQFPTHFSKINPDNLNYWQIYKSNYLGVGSDKIEEEKTKKCYEESLNKFLLSAGELILRIQEESRLERSDHVRKNSRDIPFSDGYILFNTDSEYLRYSKVQSVSFCCDSSNKLLSVHSRANNLDDVIAIWNISKAEPEIILVSHGTISCCTFGTSISEFVYAGLHEGTISIWDARKTVSGQEDCNHNRIPLYSTEIGCGHYNKIVAMYSIRNSSENNSITTVNSDKEICSMDVEGEIILWSVIVKIPLINARFIDVVLVKNTIVSLRTIHPDLTDLECTDFVLSPVNSNYAFISTNYGFIIHHFVKGGRTNVKKFHPGSQAIANCLDTCPFSTDYFLAGYANGNINLYSTLVENPLMVLSDKESSTNTCNIELMQWSKNKPFIIYTKDKSNTLHIWDLNESDLFPIYSVPFDKNITCMKLSPSIKESENTKSYMVIGTEDGILYLHQLNKEHGQQSSEIFEEHIKTFTNYVNRL